MKRVEKQQIERWKRAERAWVTAVWQRLVTFEESFQKHADICKHCYALIVWKLGTPMPKRCRRCQRDLRKE